MIYLKSTFLNAHVFPLFIDLDLSSENYSNEVWCVKTLERGPF